MAWYDKYLLVFEKPFVSAPKEIVDEVREKIQRMQSPNPLASVVVIAHNEETRLLSCLWSLSNSRCKYPIEIIGVNNNSTDATGKIFEEIGVPAYFEEQQSCGYARRCGLNNAKGKYYICIDSDTMYPPRYIETIVNRLQKPNVVAVSANWSFMPDANHSKVGLWVYELIRDLYIRMLFLKRPERGVRGLVFAYEADMGRKVGYRVELIRGEDGSMALGLKKYGKISLITSRKARAVTASNTLDSDGSLFQGFKIRVKQAVNNINFLFTKQSGVPIDEESNLVHNKDK